MDINAVIRSANIAEDIKWFLFGAGSCKVLFNDRGFQHSLEFIKWTEGNSFEVTNKDGRIYKITIEEQKGIKLL